MNRLSISAGSAIILLASCIPLLSGCSESGDLESPPRAPVFLGVAFSMSPEGVREALARQNAQLVSRSEYDQIETSPLIRDLRIEPLVSEDRVRYSSWYMPSIRIWESRAEARFQFQENKLTSIDIHLEPISRDPAGTIDILKRDLESRYSFETRADSEQVPEAYSLKFRNNDSVRVSFWINLTEPAEPILILYVFDERAADIRTQELRDREMDALGPRER